MGRPSSHAGPRKSPQSGTPWEIDLRLRQPAAGGDDLGLSENLLIAVTFDKVQLLHCRERRY